MKNNLATQLSRTNSLVIRWIAASTLVVCVGAGGFLVRGTDTREHKTTRSAPTTRPPSAASPMSGGEIAFPEIPEFDGDALGGETVSTSPDSVSVADFSRCDESPSALPSKAPEGWSNYSSDEGMSFAYPESWETFEDSGQVGATSPDGSKAFVVDLVSGELRMPLSELFAQMASERPGFDYSDPQSVLIDGEHGCSVKLEGDGHSGRIVVIPFRGGVAVLTVGHEMHPTKATVDDGWAMVASFRIGA